MRRENDAAKATLRTPQLTKRSVVIPILCQHHRKFLDSDITPLRGDRYKTCEFQTQMTTSLSLFLNSLLKADFCHAARPCRSFLLEFLLTDIVMATANGFTLQQGVATCQQLTSSCFCSAPGGVRRSGFCVFGLSRVA